MAQQTVKTRIRQKHETAANWTAATNFKPLAGELIVYEAENGQGPRLKIGDESTLAKDLPFVEAVPLAHTHAVTDVAGLQTAVSNANAHIASAHAPSNAEKNVQSDWNVTDNTSDAYILNKPTIPTVNNATLTIKKNGTNVATFTANSATDATANITVPTGAAADKGVDTSISAASTSTNLPTSQAVAAFVEGKGYKIIDTTYTFATGDSNGQIKVTPSGGSAQNISVKGLGSAAYATKGAANGVAELDASGRVPSSQLPSYVDDVIEGYLYNSKFYKESTHTTVITDETGKIYIDLSSSKTYRWSGSAYTEISASLALGETSSTAYRGDRGKIAYDHSQSAHAPANAEKNQNAFSNIKVGSTTVAADTTTDTLELVGSNVTLTPDATNDKVTIGITKTNVTTALGYTPPTTDTNYYHAPDNNSGIKIATGHGVADMYVPTGTSSSTVSPGNHTHSYNSLSDRPTIPPAITVDSSLSNTSTNPVQNKAVHAALAGKAASSHTHDDRYYTESEVDSKLNGKANSSHGNHVPATQNANNAVFLRNDNTWATVTPANIGAAPTSHSHSYNDLANKPTIPTIPSSLPANGGNADTVDNKHAIDFATAAQGTKADNALPKSGGTMTGPLLINGIEQDDGSGQLAMLKALSTQSSSSADPNWRGRAMVGAKNLTFLMGTYNGLAGLGAHSWTNAASGQGAAWAPIYIQPDGGANAAVYIGQNGTGWTANSGTLVVKGSGTTNGGSVEVRGTLTATKINGLSTVATSGNYNDLSNKPTVTTVTIKSWTTADM